MASVAYFQPFCGASGDMILGALVDAGLALEALEEGLGALGLSGWKLEAAKVMRGPIQATRVKVLLDDQHSRAHPPAPGSPPHSASYDPAPSHPASYDPAPSHPASHDPAPSHPASYDPAPPHGHPEHRHLSDILQIVQSSSLPGGVQASAAAVFRRLAQAEARIHGVPLEAVHFHEVGAKDSILDIVGTCLGLHLLGIEEVWSAPITVGTGFVKGSHGTLPLPAPATLELLRGFPMEQRDSQAELATPTGAALLTTLAKGFGTSPPMVVSSVGYGAGDDRPGTVPNVLRVILGARSFKAHRTDRVLVLETHIDDMSPQWLAHLMESLFKAGALDVAISPVLMKKSRQAHEVKVMAPVELESRILRILFSESTTFGVRRMEMDRAILEREIVSVQTPWGPVEVKVGRWGDETVTVSPEFEAVRAAAEKAGLPLKEVHQRVLEIYRSQPRR
jgi:uncharacterized protein (TIGR00299 family) protein